MQDLAAILRVQIPSTISIIGAGGKTSTMFRIAQGLGQRVIVTTTTHIDIDQAKQYPRHVVYQDEQDLEAIQREFLEGIVCVTGLTIDGHRMGSIGEERLRSLRDIAYQGGGVLLIEADGAKMLPLKAPADHEPQIPEWCEHVVLCVGMHGIGKPLDDDHVHRPELFAVVSGLEIHQNVTAEAVANAIIHPQGGIKGIPKGSRISVILNQADTEIEQANALRIANIIRNNQINQILVTSLNTVNYAPKIHSRIERIAGIVLAAGDASRYGKPKQILPVRGNPMVRHIVQQGLSAGLDPMIVVTGAFEYEIRQSLVGLTSTICHNTQWREGQSSSIKHGLSMVPEYCWGVVFLLADQPFLSDKLITKLLEQVRVEMPEVEAPMADGQRANPVYFDKVTFHDLMQIEGDTGGRAIFSKHPPKYFDWHDPSILIDIDKISDYDDYLRIINAE